METQLSQHHRKALHRLSHKILDDHSHPLSHHFQLLPSGQRYILPHAYKNIYKKSFVPLAIKELTNQNQLKDVSSALVLQHVTSLALSTLLNQPLNCIISIVSIVPMYLLHIFNYLYTNCICMLFYFLTILQLVHVKNVNLQAKDKFLPLFAMGDKVYSIQLCFSQLTPGAESSNHIPAA